MTADVRRVADDRVRHRQPHGVEIFTEYVRELASKATNSGALSVTEHFGIGLGAVHLGRGFVQMGTQSLLPLNCREGECALSDTEIKHGIVC